MYSITVHNNVTVIGTKSCRHFPLSLYGAGGVTTLGNQDCLTLFMGLGPAPFFCLGEEVNRMSSSPSGLFFAGKVLGEEVDLMSSSSFCLFFCWKYSWGRGRLNVVLPILPVFAGGNFVSSSG